MPYPDGLASSINEKFAGLDLRSDVSAPFALVAGFALIVKEMPVGHPIAAFFAITIRPIFEPRS